MATTGSCLAIAVLAGCTSAAPSHPLPSALADPTPRPPGALASAASRPCGYDHHFFTVMIASSGLQAVPGHDRAVITYDAAGLDVLEEAVDDAARFAFRATFAYDAMGSLVRASRETADAPGVVVQDVRVHDSFGRLLRRSMDLDGDDREDWIASYGYAGDGNPTRAHVVMTGAGAATYDRTYRYDDAARLAEVDRDDGPDGTIDEITRYTYDDAARMTTMVTTDRTGGVVGRSTTTYDAQDRVVSVIGSALDPRGNVTATSTDRYTYDGDRLVSEDHDDSGAPGSAVRYDWRYDHCR